MWRIEYKWSKSDSHKKRMTTNSPACNACGVSRPALTLATHILGSPPSNGNGCASTRRLVLERHQLVASLVANQLGIRTTIGGLARDAASAAGLWWLGNLDFQPARPDPLHVRRCPAVYDPIGTAFPAAINSAPANLGIQGIKEIGASVLRIFPRMTRE